MARCCAQLLQLDTICRRFRRWSEAGVWETVSVTLAGIMAGHSSIDSTTVCGHVLAAGAKGGLVDALLAARGGGFASKLDCLADGRGRLLAFHLTVGEEGDCKARDTLIVLPERAPQRFWPIRI